MAEAANADDADAAVRRDVMHQQRLEDGDAAAEHRPGGFKIDVFRQRDHPLPVGAQLIGEAAAVDDGGHRAFQTVHVVAADTGVAVAAAARRPANADLLANLQPFILRRAAQRRHPANHLVTGHQRIARHAPFIVDHRQVGVADPAVLHLHFDIFRLKVAGIVLPQRQIGARFFGGVTFNSAHDSFLGFGVVKKEV